MPSLWTIFKRAFPLVLLALVLVMVEVWLRVPRVVAVVTGAVVVVFASKFRGMKIGEDLLRQRHEEAGLAPPDEQIAAYRWRQWKMVPFLLIEVVVIMVVARRWPGAMPIIGAVAVVLMVGAFLYLRRRANESLERLRK